MNTPRFQAMLDTVADGWFALDAEWRIVAVSPAAAVRFGRAADDLIGTNLWQQTGLGPGSLVYDTFQQAATAHQSIRFEAESPVQPGEWCELCVLPRDGGLDVALRVVTERRRENDTTSILRAIADNSEDVIFAKDRAGRMSFANPATLALIGKPLDAVLGRTDLELLEDADAARAVMENDRRIMETGVPTTIEERVPLPGGTSRVWLSHKTPYRDASGAVAGLLGISRDITERKQREEALRANEERLRSHVENSPMAVVEWDKDFIVTRWSGAAARMFGWTAAETVGKPLTGLRMVHRDDEPIVQRTMARLTDGVTRQIVSSNRNYTKNGRVIHCTWYNSVLLDERGKMASVLSLVLDVTERIEAEEALREAAAKLADADRAKDEFIAVLSHELRNPLAPIRYALPLVARASLEDPAARGVAVIERQVRHLTRLVDDLLDVSRIASGKIELRRAHVTLGAILSAAVEAASPAIAAAGHHFTLAIEDDPITLCADADRVTQIVTNLLNNSAKYTPRAGDIALEASREGHDAVIRVRDSGIGIPAESLPTIFDMFRQVTERGHRARADGSRGGLGIGLALAKRLVELHGGTIEAHSAGVGQGAEFVVRLPVATGEESAEVVEARHDPTTPGRRTLKVLVVDDNADLVEMLSMTVAAAGHDVRTAVDGRSAISAAQAYQPDVVLLDLGLPVVSGLDVARELRRNPLTARAKLVALTGWGQIENRRQTEEAGFDHHLTKPTEPQALEQLLAQFAGPISP